MAEKEYKTVDERQSYVQKSGEEWEKRVMDFVNQHNSRISIDKVYCHAT